MPETIAITGTPGTGKTTLAKMLAAELNATHIDLTKLMEERKLYSEIDENKTKILDTKKFMKTMQKIIQKQRKNLLLDGHFSHILSSNLLDKIIVLRTHPKELRKRLQKQDWPKTKITENIEAEALDICLYEAVQKHGPEKVWEIDTTNQTPTQTLNKTMESLSGKRKGFEPGQVNWLEGVF